MANWNGAFRTNYFEVKDADAFRAWVGSLKAEDKIDLFESEGKFGLGGYCAVPSGRDLTEDERRELAEIGEDPADLEGLSYFDAHDDGIDFAAELAQHLAEGQVALVYEAGHEKLRYVSGCAYAVNHLGEIIKHINLNDVFSALEATGVTPASY